MRQVNSQQLRPGIAFLLRFLSTVIGLFCAGNFVSGQTQQPYLFATTNVNGQSAVATFVRNDTSGALAGVSGSPFVLTTSGCAPSVMDAKGRFLFGPCGDGVAAYSFNSGTGSVSEVANSPFAASSSGRPWAVIAESTGQFVYVLKMGAETFPTSTTMTLDSFVIDPANQTLKQPVSQTMTLAGTAVSAVADANGHFLHVLLEISGTSTYPSGGSCRILFDTQTGLPRTAAGSLCSEQLDPGARPLGIVEDSKGTLIGTWARGEIFGNFTVAAVSPTDGTYLGSDIYTLNSSTDIPGSVFFDPTGQLVYFQSQADGLRVFQVTLSGNSVTLTELANSPLTNISNTAPLTGLPNPAANFTYVGGSDSITAYAIDLGTGYPGNPVPSDFSHTPALSFQPVLATAPPAGQPVSAPAVQISSQSLSFGPIHPGQISGPQALTITSIGNQALTIASIQFTPSAGPFTEMDSCMGNPVLTPGASCTISISYAPTVVGTNQGTLVIADNASGSPQSISLNGTATAPPPPAPAVTLMPGTLTFSGTTTQGTSSAPQPVTITNSGNAALNFTAAAALSGLNAGDFSIGGNTCASSLAAGSSCTVAIVFSPLATGVRTTNLSFADSASNSPQSVTVNGTATPAAVIAAAPGGSVSASVAAGQAAMYALQATPGAGFSGTLSFACGGLPTGTNCNAPSVTVSNGASANFTITVTTSGSAFLFPRFFPFPFSPSFSPEAALTLIALLCLILLTARWENESKFCRRDGKSWVAAACLGVILAGCGGGGATSSAQPPPVITPNGSYSITVTPTATPNGSAKAIQLTPIPLTLVVK